MKIQSKDGAMKVLITPSTFCKTSNKPFQILEDAGFEVINNPYKRKINQTELALLLTGVQGVVAGLEQYNYDILSQSELKIISRCGSGLSNIDLDAAKKLGIAIYNTPEGPTQSVAELTVGCLLGLIRDVSRVNDLMHQGKWEKHTGRLLKDMEVLIIGFGKIGQTVARILSEIGARILAYDPFLKDHEISKTFNKVELTDGLQSADVIILHSSGEEMLLGETEFVLMKPGVYILNAARGGLIDEGSLEKALITGKVAGAWLDTFKEEPYSGDLTKYNQVILTPHIGSYTREGRQKMEMEAVNNLLLGSNNLQ